MSWMVQMFGWLRADAAWASRWNRSKDLTVLGHFFRQELERDEAVELVSSAL
jgi:hypothetical protein